MPSKQDEAFLRTKLIMRSTLPGRDKDQLVEQTMCNLCGAYGVEGRDVEGPWEEGALYRCKDQPKCRKAKDRLAIIRGWKGSGDEREGRRVGMAGDHIIIERLEPTLTKGLRNSPMLAKELMTSVEFQVRCMSCDRRDTFFVNKLLVERPTPEFRLAFHDKTIEKLLRLSQLGCPHVPGGARA